MDRMTEEFARAWAHGYAVPPQLIPNLLAEIDRLRGIARNAADLLEQKGYDETASRVRARVAGQRVGLDPR